MEGRRTAMLGFAYHDRQLHCEGVPLAQTPPTPGEYVAALRPTLERLGLTVPRAAEVLVTGDRHQVVRRRESDEDLGGGRDDGQRVVVVDRRVVDRATMGQAQVVGARSRAVARARVAPGCRTLGPPAG